MFMIVSIFCWVGYTFALYSLGLLQFILRLCCVLSDITIAFILPYLSYTDDKKYKSQKMQKRFMFTFY